MANNNIGFRVKAVEMYKKEQSMLYVQVLANGLHRKGNVHSVLLTLRRVFPVTFTFVFAKYNMTI
jgi:hypothetical protein